MSCRQPGQGGFATRRQPYLKVFSMKTINVSIVDTHSVGEPVMNPSVPAAGMGHRGSIPGHFVCCS